MSMHIFRVRMSFSGMGLVLTRMTNQDDELTETGDLGGSSRKKIGSLPQSLTQSCVNQFTNGSDGMLHYVHITIRVHTMTQHFPLRPSSLSAQTNWGISSSQQVNFFITIPLHNGNLHADVWSAKSQHLNLIHNFCCWCWIRLQKFATGKKLDFPGHFDRFAVKSRPGDFCPEPDPYAVVNRAHVATSPPPHNRQTRDLHAATPWVVGSCTEQAHCCRSVFNW